MDGGAAAATIGVLVQNLINVSKEELSLMRGLDKDAEKLKETLTMVQSFLDDAEKKFITADSVKIWLKKLEAVAFDADNVLDELNYHLLSKKMKAIKTDKKKVPSCFPSFNHYVRRRQMALTIQEINKTFESVKKNATELGLVSILSSAPAAPDDAGPETNSFALDPIFIGREDDVSKIVEILTRSSPTEQVVSVLPIVGMGGLGKTTLTRNVFNHEKIKTHFGEHIWVHVPKNFDPLSLLKEILTRLTSNEEEDGSSSEVILKKLQEALKTKTYLLVLDDVWDQDRLKWEGFTNSLSGISSMKGNGIIVTTRITEVALVVKTLDIHQLNGLSEADCWSIIEQKAFAGRDIPSGIEIIGRNIAKKCQGLPLAANVVGGVLRHKSEDEWRSIEEKWLCLGDENNITRILKLSFNHLSSPSLKKCFAYCSSFPKGEEINKQQLIELWMAEGFLQADQTNDMETMGDEFLKLLLQNSLLQVVERDNYGNVKLCSIHDLVHDLACSVSNGIYPVRYTGSENNGDESSSIAKEQAKCLRTLFFKGEISDIMLLDFKSLHVLKLEDSYIEELPHSIRELIHLRYISISNTRIVYLPDSIGELYLLQTLRARHCLRKLPSTLKHLIRLRHLHVDDHVELPPNIGRLTSLQSLKYFHVGDEEGHRIGELGSLKNLKGEIHILNLEKVHGEEEAKSANLFQKPNIVKLVLQWNGCEGGETNHENVLEGLRPHPNLKSLEILGFKGTRFSSWTLKMAVEDKRHWVGLNNLMELRLEDCEECEEIPMLGHLPHLKFLYLCKLRNVKSLGFSFYGIDDYRSVDGVCKEKTIMFRALKGLKLRGMSSLIEWADVEFQSAAETHPREVNAFPCLEYLEIFNCKELRRAPSQFPCLKELEIFGMDSGMPLANICGIKSTSITKIKIFELSGLEHLPNWLFYNNQHLSELRIISCPKLRELPNGLHTLSSLEKLNIENCGNLELIPYSSDGKLRGLTSLRRLIIRNCRRPINFPGPCSFSSLEELEISCCENLKSIPYSSSGQSEGLTSLRSLEIRNCKGLINLPAEMLESCAPSLEKLSLRQLGGAVILPMKMPRLTELTILGVPNLITSSSIEIGNFRSLQGLSVGPASSDSGDCVNYSFKKTIDRILQATTASQPFHGIELSGMEDWDSSTLPEELQHLTALASLELKNFGMEELPEWFGKLSSLRTLSLRACKRLRRLPSMEAMRRCTKLTWLSIYDCPELSERIRTQQQQSCEDDSEWSKISHLPEICDQGHWIRSNGLTVDAYRYLDEARQQ